MTAGDRIEVDVYLHLCPRHEGAGWCPEYDDCQNAPGIWGTDYPERSCEGGAPHLGVLLEVGAGPTAGRVRIQLDGDAQPEWRDIERVYPAQAAS